MSGYQIQGSYQDELSVAGAYGSAAGDAGHLEQLLAASAGYNQIAGDSFAMAGALPSNFGKMTPAQVVALAREYDRKLGAQARQIQALHGQLQNQRYQGAPPQFRGGFGAAAPGAQVVTNSTPNQLIGAPLGFRQTGILTLAQADVTSQPQTLFRPERLVIPSSIASNFTVRDIKIGNISMLNNGTPLPGVLFSELAVGVAMKWIDAQVSQIVTISVTNDFTGTLTFSAAMLGTGAY